MQTILYDPISEVHHFFLNAVPLCSRQYGGVAVGKYIFGKTRAKKILNFQVIKAGSRHFLSVSEQYFGDPHFNDNKCVV